MCYTGKCIYEDYMGNCQAPNDIKNPCEKGRKKQKRQNIKFTILVFTAEVIHKIKWVCSKKYRQDCIDFEENPFKERK